MRQNFLLLIIILILIGCRSKLAETSQVNRARRDESIEKLIQKFDSLSEYSYKVDQIWKSSEPGSDTHIAANCLFTKVLADSIVGAYYVMTGNGTSTVYNGDVFLHGDSLNKVVDIYNLVTEPNPKNRVKSPMAYYLSYNEIMLDLKDRFRSMKNSITILPDTIIGNQESFVIKIAIRNSGFFQNHEVAYEIVAFDKSTLIPVFAQQFDCKSGNDSPELVIEASFHAFDSKVTKSDRIYDITSIPFYIETISYSTDTENKSIFKIGDKAPEWKGQLIKGDSISSKDFNGKITLLDFTAVNCGPCLKANEVLNKIDKKYKNSEFKVLSVYPIDRLEAIKNLVDKSNIIHPIIYNAKKIQEDFHINSYPSLFIVGYSGKIEYISIGFADVVEKELEETIDRLRKQ